MEVGVPLLALYWPVQVILNCITVAGAARVKVLSTVVFLLPSSFMMTLYLNSSSPTLPVAGSARVYASEVSSGAGFHSLPSKYSASQYLAPVLEERVMYLICTLAPAGCSLSLVAVNSQ